MSKQGEPAHAARSLETVRVPAEMFDAFASAEAVVARYFADRAFSPERGTIEISGERYVLVRAASLSVEFFGVVRKLYGAGREREADAFALNILFDLAHAIGRSDAKDFHARMGLDDRSRGSRRDRSTPRTRAGRSSTSIPSRARGPTRASSSSTIIRTRSRRAHGSGQGSRPRRPHA